jgi:hypothetical protein
MNTTDQPTYLHYTAEQANAVASARAKEIEIETMEKIMNEIITASKNGDFSVTFDGSLYTSQIEHLRMLGYKVGVSTGCISWFDKNNIGLE